VTVVTWDVYWAVSLNGLAVYPLLVFGLGCGWVVLCFQGCVSGDDVIGDVIVMSC